MKVVVKSSSLMIVDADYLAYRGYYAFSNPSKPETFLVTSTGIESGGFYGFFSLLLRKIRDYSPKKVYICWGDKRENLKRKKLNPNYKETRKKVPPSFLS